MGVADLQAFLESASLEGGALSVDLLKIARNVTQRQQPHNTNRKIRPIGNKLKLIVDAENCLDRLYGGYFSDWACGGQWNRMVQFLSLLTQAIERGNIELAVVFNGTIEQCRANEWVAEQANVRQKVGMVLKHINTKATPPPKIWWTAPTCLRSALRMALRHLGVSVMCTMDDHHQEVIAYCREYGFHGLLADDAEYAAFDPPRYFSSEHLKLTYKGSIETKEYMMSELTKTLKITQEQVCVMAALLGNFLLPESDLQDLYKKIGLTKPTTDSGAENNIKKLAEYVSNLPSHTNMESLVIAVFGSIDDKRASKFRQSVQYYLNGTASGFLKYCTPPTKNKPKKNHLTSTTTPTSTTTTPPIIVQNDLTPENANTKTSDDQDLDTSGFASETTEQERETLQNYKVATAHSMVTNFDDLEVNLLKDMSLDDAPISLDSSASFNGIISNGGSAISSNKQKIVTATNSGNKVSILVGNSSSSSGGIIGNNNKTAAPQSTNKPKNANNNVTIPTVSPDVLRTASLRHQKGLMAPMILHVLSTQEVRLPCLMEDEGNREFPPIHDIYQSLRQRVYAVLFNLHHLRYVHTKKKESGELPENSSAPEIIVKEWIYSRSNPYQKPEEVRADPLPWAVPTLQRLWFGPAVDDKRRRMRALLSCLNSDTPLILNTAYVPQHMLVMACVLRYIMSQQRQIMRRNELDAFLCHAFNPNLMNPQYLQELTLNVVTSRGVQLAALFMEGVDMALLANDACGAPLPWLMCCPWLYFDGKLFHYTLTRSSHAKSILELCDNCIDRVVKVERMRKAILEGLDVRFAKVPLPPFAGGMYGPPNQPSWSTDAKISSFSAPLLRQGLPPPPPPHCLPTMNLPSSNHHRGTSSLRQRPIPSRGGQLQVAGVVVGSWGANYGYQGNMNHAMNRGGGGGAGVGGMMPAGSAGNYMQQPSQGGSRGRGIGNYHHPNNVHHIGGGSSSGSGNRGRGSGNGGHNNRRPGPPTFSVNARRNQGNKKRNTNKSSNKGQKQQGHTLTVRTDSGDLPVNKVVITEDGTTTTTSITTTTTITNNTTGGNKEDFKTITATATTAVVEHKGQGDAPCNKEMTAVIN